MNIDTERDGNLISQDVPLIMNDPQVVYKSQPSKHPTFLPFISIFLPSSVEGSTLYIKNYFEDIVVNRKRRNTKQRKVKFSTSIKSFILSGRNNNEHRHSNHS